MFHHPSVAGESEAVRTSANIETPVADLADDAQSGRLDSAGFAKFGQDRSTDVCQSRPGDVQFSREKICSGCAGSCAGVEQFSDFEGFTNIAWAKSGFKLVPV